jgi:DNA-binding GntR family transcriptional regulator
MATFEALLPQSLADRVAAEIRNGVSSGRLRPGERLVEADLATQMDISRAPVREALRRLEFEGLVERRIRRGYIVRELSIEGLHEIYDLRVLLEPLLAQYSAARIGHHDVLALRAVVNRMRVAAQRDDWTEVVNADREFHALVGKLSGRPLTAQIFECLNEQVRRFTALMRSSYWRIEEIADEHEDLVAAIASGNAQRAEQQMRSHLEDARRRLALILGEEREPDGCMPERGAGARWTASDHSSPATSRSAERRAKAKETEQPTHEADDRFVA